MCRIPGSLVRLFGWTGLFVVVSLGGIGGCGSSSTGSDTTPTTTTTPTTRDLTGSLSSSGVTGLTLAGHNKSVVTCADAKVCCFGYDGGNPATSALTANADGTCNFDVTLPLGSFCFCGVFSGTDADSDGCPDTEEGFFESGIFVSNGVGSDNSEIDGGAFTQTGDSVDIPTGVFDELDEDGDGASDADDTDDDADGTADTDDDYCGDWLCDGLQIDTDADGNPDIFGEWNENFEDCLDADSDGVCNLVEEDPDNDGLNAADDLDDDGDGTADTSDFDDNGNGVADAVETDSDGDGVPNLYDDDVDGDGSLNSDDADDDGDGVADGSDLDVNGDGMSDDTESTDTDDDGVPDTADADDDGDGTTDDLDTDDDGDGTVDTSETTTTDADGDGLSDDVDTDDDGDGTEDGSDSDADGNGTADETECPGSSICNNDFECQRFADDDLTDEFETDNVQCGDDGCCELMSGGCASDAACIVSEAGLPNAAFTCLASGQCQGDCNQGGDPGMCASSFTAGGATCSGVNLCTYPAP